MKLVDEMKKGKNEKYIHTKETHTSNYQHKNLLVESSVLLH